MTGPQPEGSPQPDAGPWLDDRPVAADRFSAAGWFGDAAQDGAQGGPDGSPQPLPPPPFLPEAVEPPAAPAPPAPPSAPEPLASPLAEVPTQVNVPSSEATQVISSALEPPAPAAQIPAPAEFPELAEATADAGVTQVVSPGSLPAAPPAPAGADAGVTQVVSPGSLPAATPPSGQPHAGVTQVFSPGAVPPAAPPPQSPGGFPPPGLPPQAPPHQPPLQPPLQQQWGAPLPPQVPPAGPPHQQWGGPPPGPPPPQAPPHQQWGAPAPPAGPPQQLHQQQWGDQRQGQFQQPQQQWGGGQGFGAGHAAYGGYGQAVHPSQYAEWGSRALGWLVDYGLPYGVAYLVVLVGAFTSSIVMLLGWLLLLVAFGFVLWNAGYQAGTTGQSIGKKMAKVRLVKPETGQPIGGGAGVLRVICHAVEVGIGWFAPLFTEKKQTFADMIVGTVVIKSE